MKRYAVTYKKGQQTMRSADFEAKRAEFKAEFFEKVNKTEWWKEQSQELKDAMADMYAIDQLEHWQNGTKDNNWNI